VKARWGLWVLTVQPVPKDLAFSAIPGTKPGRPVGVGRAPLRLFADEAGRRRQAPPRALAGGRKGGPIDSPGSYSTRGSRLLGAYGPKRHAPKPSPARVHSVSKTVHRGDTPQAAPPPFPPPLQGAHVGVVDLRCGGQRNSVGPSSVWITRSNPRRRFSGDRYGERVRAEEEVAGGRPAAAMRRACLTRFAEGAPPKPALVMRPRPAPKR